MSVEALLRQVDRLIADLEHVDQRVVVVVQDAEAPPPPAEDNTIQIVVKQWHLDPLRHAKRSDGDDDHPVAPVAADVPVERAVVDVVEPVLEEPVMPAQETGGKNMAV